MQFKLLPILDKMEELYLLPRNRSRFEEYLQLLQGNDKNDMILPIASFNPMAKEDILSKIEQLQRLDTENKAIPLIEKINNSLPDKSGPIIQVVINLADDMGGSWTNKFTTDFNSKFKIKPFVKRNFCTPHFWTSENYNIQKVEQRISASIFRSIYVRENGFPVTLSNHLQQEIFVQKSLYRSSKIAQSTDFQNLKTFFEQNKEEDNYNILFNFFYGDQAAQSLGYPSYGISGVNGFDYAAFLAIHSE